MKKSLLIVLCLLLAACTLPAIALADAPQTPTDSTGGVIYFLNPTAIAVSQGKLFVADCIEEGKSVVLCFDVSGGAPVYSFTQEVEGNVVNLSAKADGLYAILPNSVQEFSFAEGGLQSVQTWDVQGAINFVQGSFSGQSAEYYAADQNVNVRRDGAFDATAGTFRQILDIHAVDQSAEANDEFVYVLYRDDGGHVDCVRLKDALQPGGDVFNKTDAAQKTNNDAAGLFGCPVDGKVFPGFFSADAISYVEIASAICSTVPLLSYNTELNGTLEDVTADDTALYVLNSRHKVEIYKKDASGSYQYTATIGTETLPRPVPSIEELNSFTLVTCKGYPANIVFKTSEEATSIELLIDNATQYIVLGWDNEDPNFYYVLVGDRFGWVKKSDGATEPGNDSKLTVENTTVGNDAVEYKAKFASLNATYLAPLPRKHFLTEEYWHVHNQTASQRTEVTVLQRFTEGDVVWLYVTFEGQYGFVRDVDVGKFYLSAKVGEGQPVVGKRKANGKLFGYVQLYDNNEPSTMTDDHRALNADGEEIKHLSSGTHVTLVQTYDNGTALVQVTYGNGTTATGYCFADMLIETSKLTTNATFGLAATGVAIALAITLSVLFARRSKKQGPGNTGTGNGNNGNGNGPEE